jgi:hypothetical protein
MTPHQATVNEIIQATRISKVYVALGGPKLHGTRGPAFWREGKGLNVHLDDAKGIWHDFVSGEGGGVLDLVMQVQGGTRREALRWVAAFTGIPLDDDSPEAAETRERWIEERRRIERHLPNAAYWRSAAVSLIEDILVGLKATLFDGAPGPLPDIGEIGRLTTLLARLERIEDAELVAEYSWWHDTLPASTGLLVRAGRSREQRHLRVLTSYMRMIAPLRQIEEKHESEK